MKLFKLTHQIIKSFALIITIANISIPLYAHHGDEQHASHPPTPRILSSTTPTPNLIDITANLVTASSQAPNTIDRATNLVTASSQVPPMEVVPIDALPVYTDINGKMEVTATIPIQLPNGTANKTPQLALHYNDKRSHIYTGDTPKPSCYIEGQPSNDEKKQCFEKRTQNNKVKWAQSPNQNSLFESTIDHGKCFLKTRKGRAIWWNVQWAELPLSGQSENDIKTCYSKYQYIQNNRRGWSNWSWRWQEIDLEIKWATSADTPPVWEINDVDLGEIEPTLWSIKGIPSVQKCQSIPADLGSLCLVDGQDEIELQKITIGTQSETYYRLIVTEQPQNSIHVVADGNSLSMHNHVTGEVLQFNKSQRLADTYTLSQSYTLPFKGNVTTYHWLPANRSSHGQLHGYQLSHILYGVNYEDADALSLKNEEIHYNHKIIFTWFNQRATGYPNNIIVQSKVLLDGRHDGTHFTEVFRYEIRPYQPDSMISARNCHPTSASENATDICPQTVIGGDALAYDQDLNFHNIGMVTKKVPENTHDNQSQQASFIYQNCTANHLGGCLTGIISGPRNKQWSHKVNFNDSNKEQKLLLDVVKRRLWKTWQIPGPEAQRITRTQSTNAGDPNTPNDTQIIHQTEWTVNKSDKLPSGHYGTMKITDERESQIVERVIHNNTLGVPAIMHTQYIAPELGTFPRESTQYFIYNSQHQLTNTSVIERQQTSETNSVIQKHVVADITYKDINVSDAGVSNSRHTRVSIPERTIVIENLGRQGAGRHIAANTQRLSETEWTYTDGNPNQYEVTTYICEQAPQFTTVQMREPFEQRQCGDDSKVSSTKITGLTTDWIEDDDSDDKARTLEIEDTVNQQTSTHQYSDLGLPKAYKASESISNENALSEIITTNDVNHWQVNKVSANNSPYVQLFNEYTLNGTASLQMTFYGDHRVTGSKKLSHNKSQIDPLTLAINGQKAFASNGIDLLSDISTDYVRPSQDGTSANIGMTLTDNITQNTMQQVYNASGRVTSMSNKDASGDINFISTQQYYTGGARQGLLHSTSSQIGSDAATVSALAYDPNSRAVTTTQGDNHVTKTLQFVPYGSQVTSTDENDNTFTVTTTPLRTETRDKDGNAVITSIAYWQTCPKVPGKAFRVETTSYISAEDSQSKTLSKTCFDTRDNILYHETNSSNVTANQYYPNNQLKHKESCEKQGTNLICNSKQTYHYYTHNTTRGLIGQLRQITYTAKPDDGSRTDVTYRKIRYEYETVDEAKKGLLHSKTSYPSLLETEYIKEVYRDFDDAHRPQQIDYTFALHEDHKQPITQTFTINKKYYEDGDYKHKLERITYPSLLDKHNIRSNIRPSTTLKYMNQGTINAPRHRLDTSMLSVNGKDITAYQHVETQHDTHQYTDTYALATGRLAAGASSNIDTLAVNDAKDDLALQFTDTVPTAETRRTGDFTLRYDAPHRSLEYKFINNKVRKHEQWDGNTNIADFGYKYNDQQQLESISQTHHLPSEHQGGGFYLTETSKQTYHYNHGDISSIDREQPSHTPKNSTTKYRYDSGLLTGYSNNKDDNLKQLKSVEYYASNRVSDMRYHMPSTGATHHTTMTYYGDSRVKTVTTEGHIEGDKVNIKTRYIYGADNKVGITVEDIDLGDKCPITRTDRKQQKVSFEISGLYKWVQYIDNCQTNEDRTFAYHYLPSDNPHAEPVLREFQIAQGHHNRHYLADLLTYQYDRYGSLIAQTGPDINALHTDNSVPNTLLLRQYFTPHGKRVIAETSTPSPATATTLPPPTIRVGGTTPGYGGNHRIEVTSSGNSITNASTIRPTTPVHNDNVQLAHQVYLNYNGIDVTGGLSNHRQISGTELLNMGDYRLYAPDIGRFINPDDRVFPEKGEDGYNRYVYADNDPVHKVDRDGHMASDAEGAMPTTIGQQAGGHTPYIGNPSSPQTRFEQHTAGHIGHGVFPERFGLRTPNQALMTVFWQVVRSVPPNLRMIRGLFHRTAIILPPNQVPVNPPIPVAAAVAPAAAAVPDWLSDSYPLNNDYRTWPDWTYMWSLQYNLALTVLSGSAVVVAFLPGRPLNRITGGSGKAALMLLLSVSTMHSSLRNMNSALNKMPCVQHRPILKSMIYKAGFVASNQLAQELTLNIYDILVPGPAYTHQDHTARRWILFVANWLYCLVDIKVNDWTSYFVQTSTVKGMVEVGCPDTSSIPLFLRMNHVIPGNLMEIPFIILITQARLLATNYYYQTIDYDEHLSIFNTDCLYGYVRVGCSILGYLAQRAYLHLTYHPERGVATLENSPIHVYATFHFTRHLAGTATTLVGLLHWSDAVLYWEVCH